MNPIAELRGRCPARPEGAVAPAGGCRAGAARSRGQGAGGGSGSCRQGKAAGSGLVSGLCPGTGESRVWGAAVMSRRHNGDRCVRLREPLSAKRECCSREKEALVLPNVSGRKNVKLYFNVEQ